MSTHTTSSFEQLHRRAVRVTSKPGIDAGTRDRLDELWATVHGGVDTTDPEQFARFATSFLQDRYAATAADGREQRLCGCGNPACNLKRGELPPSLQRPGSRFDSRQLRPADAQEYVTRHPGAQVLRDALEAWERQSAETRQALRRIIQVAERETAGATPVDAANVPGVSTGTGDETDE